MFRKFFKSKFKTSTSITELTNNHNEEAKHITGNQGKAELL